MKEKKEEALRRERPRRSREKKGSNPLRNGKKAVNQASVEAGEKMSAKR